MARGAAFLLLALAACAQASLPTNIAQNVAQTILRQNRVSVFDQKGKPLCKECEKIVMALKKIVDNPETEEKFRDALTKVCDIPLISKFKSQCLGLVNDAVVGIHELQSLLDNPTEVCETIKFCDAEAPGIKSVTKRLFLSAISKVIQDVKQPSPLMAIDTCGLCESALNELKRWLEVPQVIEKIEDGLESVCKYFGKYNTKCRLFIENDFGKVFDIIVDALCQPEQTCTALHLCKQTSSFNQMMTRPIARIGHPHLERLVANMTSIQTSKGLDIGCLACKTGVSAALKELDRDSVEASLTKDITNFVCKLLPASQQAGCFDFLGIYGKAALDLTFHEWTPEQICEEVHACSKAALHQLEVLSQSNSAVACDACKALSKTLAFELQQSNVQQDVINVLNKGCSVLPTKYANKVRCQAYVEIYVPYILEDILALSYLPQLCTVLKLC